ncbi:MAG: hypothetical protein BWX84_03264 [Verrucomicrobia bacterium ADurb.Bin118]|nr:MAG: hypothetical protein BWX84_03264 [Verrucomicrobia bacterium ADurb.Bin118]
MPAGGDWPGVPAAAGSFRLRHRHNPEFSSTEVTMSPVFPAPPIFALSLQTGLPYFLQLHD